jgi:hypothetical protein
VNDFLRSFESVNIERDNNLLYVLQHFNFITINTLSPVVLAKEDRAFGTQAGSLLSSSDAREKILRRSSYESSIYGGSDF